jgi:hypothetical protein
MVSPAIFANGPPPTQEPDLCPPNSFEINGNCYCSTNGQWTSDGSNCGSVNTYSTGSVSNEFVLGAAGDDCPNGQFITSLEMCESALIALGMTIDSYFTQSSLNYVYGCSYQTSSNQLHFNTNTGGTPRWTEQPVCFSTSSTGSVITYCNNGFTLHGNCYCNTNGQLSADGQDCPAGCQDHNGYLQSFFDDPYFSCSDWVSYCDYNGGATFTINSVAVTSAFLRVHCPATCEHFCVYDDDDCPSNSYYSNGNCYCNSNGQWTTDGSNCGSVITYTTAQSCPPQAHLGSNGQCYCNTNGQHTVNGSNCEESCSDNDQYFQNLFNDESFSCSDWASYCNVYGESITVNGITTMSQYIVMNCPLTCGNCPDINSIPTASPSMSPVINPTAQPSVTPSVAPSAKPTVEQIDTAEPSVSPSVVPSAKPTVKQIDTAEPSVSPSVVPSAKPIVDQTDTAKPSVSPSAIPSVTPTENPATSSPTDQPSRIPTSTPTEITQLPSQPKVQIDILIVGVTSTNFEQVKDALRSAIIISLPDFELTPPMISFVLDSRVSRRQMSVTTEEFITAEIKVDSNEEASRLAEALQNENGLQDQMNNALSDSNLVDVEVTSLENSLAVLPGNDVDSNGSKDSATMLTLVVTGLVFLALVSSVVCYYYYWPQPKLKVENDIESAVTGRFETAGGEKRSLTESSLRKHRSVFE